jgi:HSP20 family molecular chaperone IbpA
MIQMMNAHMQQMEQEMNMFFNDDFFAPSFSMPYSLQPRQLMSPQFTSSTSSVSYNIDNQKDKFIVKVNFPKDGAKPSINAAIKNGVLNLTGNIQMKRETKDKNNHIIMRTEQYEQFQRSFMLPKNIESSKMKTELKHNSFLITIPKK